MSQHLTIPQAAAALSLSVSNVRWLINGRKLDAEKVIDPNGRAIWLITAESVEQYNQKRKAAKTTR